MSLNKELLWLADQFGVDPRPLSTNGHLSGAIFMSIKRMMEPMKDPLSKTGRAQVDLLASDDPAVRALMRLLMWFNADGSPCDGFMLREAVFNARKTLGFTKNGRIGRKRKAARDGG